MSSDHIDINSLPPDVRSRLRAQLKNTNPSSPPVGETTFLYIHNPTTTALTTEDADPAWLLAAISQINFYSAVEPTPVHYAVMHRHLKEKEGIEDHRAVGIAADELAKRCRQLQLEMPYRDLEGAPDGTEDANMFDMRFAEFLRRPPLGKKGKEAALVIEGASRANHARYKLSGYESVHRPDVWSWWVDKVEPWSIFAPFIHVLAAVVWNDIGEKIWERERKKRRQTKESGHLTDLKLRPRLSLQADLFDQLSPGLREIVRSGTEIVNGLDLTKPQHKILHALTRLLHKKSQSNDPGAVDYFTGNAQPALVRYGDNASAPAPVLVLTRQEFYEEVTGTSRYSGAEMKTVDEHLQQMAIKPHLIRYHRTDKVNGEERTTIIEEHQTLVRKIEVIQGLTNAELARHRRGDQSVKDEKGKLVIVLNPIFRDQIGTKFVLRPEDFDARLDLAAGGGKYVTTSMELLGDYLLRAKSVKDAHVEIGERKLACTLKLDNYLKRPKVLHDRLKKDADAYVNLGLIKTYVRRPGKKEPWVWEFEINEKFE